MKLEVAGYSCGVAVHGDRAGSDDHRGVEHDGRNRAVEQDPRHFGAGAHVRGQVPVGGEPAEVDDPAHAGLPCRLGEDGRGAASGSAKPFPPPMVWIR